MEQFQLTVEATRSREEATVGRREQIIVKDIASVESEAISLVELPKAITAIGGCPYGYKARVRITFNGELDKDGNEQPDMLRDVFLDPKQEGFRTWEPCAAGYQRVKQKAVEYPVATKAEQIAELERVKVDAEAQLAVLKAEAPAE
jgi:hypothetical protein